MTNGLGHTCIDAYACVCLCVRVCVFVCLFQLEVLSDWINPLYLDVGVQSQIQKQFEEDSQIQLPDFLLVRIINNN